MTHVSQVEGLPQGPGPSGRLFWLGSPFGPLAPVLVPLLPKVTPIGWEGEKRTRPRWSLGMAAAAHMAVIARPSRSATQPGRPMVNETATIGEFNLTLFKLLLVRTRCYLSLSLGVAVGRGVTGAQRVRPRHSSHARTRSAARARSAESRHHERVPSLLLAVGTRCVMRPETSSAGRPARACGHLCV